MKIIINESQLRLIVENEGEDNLFERRVGLKPKSNFESARYCTF